jgi:hypothetical protein
MAHKFIENLTFEKEFSLLRKVNKMLIRVVLEAYTKQIRPQGDLR